MLARAIGVPLGMEDPAHPNIAMTLWRTVADQGGKVYYFESVLMPAVMWADLKKIDFKEGSGARKIAKFEPAEPFKWLTTE